MPTKKTVLILGAGASHPYRFPLGHKLLVDICDTVDQYNSNASILKEPQRHFITQWKIHCQVDDAAITDFARLLRTSGHSSVDAFLAQAGTRQPKLVEMGKAAIALRLLPCENEENLFHDVHKDSDDWYRILWSSISDLETLENLSIVTLNYDRSIEHFLYSAIRSSQYCDHEEASETLARIAIIHPHGQLGFHPYTNSEECREYGSMTKVDIAIRQIKIVSQVETSTIEFAKAREFVKAAEVICILGFSFNRDTLNRLGVLQNENKGLQVFASTCGLGAGFVDELKEGMPVKGRNCQFIPQKAHWILGQSNALKEPIKRDLSS